MNWRWSCHEGGWTPWGISALRRALLALALSVGCGCSGAGVRHSDRVVALKLIDANLNIDLSDAIIYAGCPDGNDSRRLAGEELAAVIPSHLIPVGKQPFAAARSNSYWLVAFTGEAEGIRSAWWDHAYGFFSDDWTPAGWVETQTAGKQYRKLLFMDWCPQKRMAVIAEDVGGKLRVGVCGPDSLRLREVFHADHASSVELRSWFDGSLVITQEKGAVWRIDPVTGESALVCQLPVDRGFVRDARASPDGRYLAVEMGDFKWTEAGLWREAGLWIVDLLTGRWEPLTWEKTTYRHRPVCWPAPDTIRFLRFASQESGYQLFEARLDLSEW